MGVMFRNVRAPEQQAQIAAELIHVLPLITAQQRFIDFYFKIVDIEPSCVFSGFALSSLLANFMEMSP
jgi:hypothetical protein